MRGAPPTVDCSSWSTESKRSPDPCCANVHQADSDTCQQRTASTRAPSMRATIAATDQCPSSASGSRAVPAGLVMQALGIGSPCSSATADPSPADPTMARDRYPACRSIPIARRHRGAAQRRPAVRGRTDVAMTPGGFQAAAARGSTPRRCGTRTGVHRAGRT